MDTMQSKLKQKLLHILGNLKGGVITADEALQKIEQAYAEKAEKHQEVADILNDLKRKAKEYDWTMDDILRNISTTADLNQKFADEELNKN